MDAATASSRRVAGKRGSTGEFEVQSRTTPGVVYYPRLTYEQGQLVRSRCSCRWRQIHPTKSCFHLDEAVRLVGVERVDMALLADPKPTRRPGPIRRPRYVAPEDEWAYQPESAAGRAS